MTRDRTHNQSSRSSSGAPLDVHPVNGRGVTAGLDERESPFTELLVALPHDKDFDAAARLIRQLGGRLYRFEAISRAGGLPVDQFIQGLWEGQFDDIVFASAHGVRLIVELALQLGSSERILSGLHSVRKIVLGPRALQALRDAGFSADVSTPNTSREVIARTLEGLEFSGRTVGIAGFGSTETALELLRRKGANVLHPVGAGDPQRGAADVIRHLLSSELRVLMLGSVAEVEQLWHTASAMRKLAQLKQRLSDIALVAVGAEAGAELTRRGIRVQSELPRSALVQPSALDLLRAFGMDGAGAQSERVPESIRARADGKRTLVVIGNGMTSQRFCEKVREYDQERHYDILVLGEEPHAAYDRVHLTRFFETQSGEALSLGGPSWYEQNDIRLLLGERAVRLDRKERLLFGSSGRRVAYDVAVLCTGSAPFVPPIDGVDKRGVFVYRTLDDVAQIAAYARSARSAIVLGGGLLGLEAAKAVLDLGLETRVVESAPRLMPRQLDERGARLLARSVEALGVQVHTGRVTTAVLGEETCAGIAFSDGTTLAGDMLIISAGIRPRDELARDSSLAVGKRGGVIVDDRMCTSDPSIFAIGECALHRDQIYGLVGPCFEMAEILAHNLTDADERRYAGSDLWAKLKLLGVDVASFGDPFADTTTQTSIVYEDLVRGIYKKLTLSADGRRLMGGILVGDAANYASLVALLKSGQELPEVPEELLIGPLRPSAKTCGTDLVCSCNAVSRSSLVEALRGGQCGSVDELKKKTRAGTGCGGCIPLMADILGAELASQGKVARRGLCEHFDYSRRELYEIIKVRKIRTFDDLVSEHGKGEGCEVCKPAVASILASVHNELILQHSTLQDTNDRYLANIQRGGLYSVVPRVPGGEITPEKLIALGEVAKKFGLYTKITGGQRIDLLGARLEQLPDIWEDLVNAGFESGHAYGKAMRTVKSCVGTTWCRFGVQDSVALAIRIENRYKGIRAPHKMKAAVSGCIRECAEAQSKDFGVIATEKGWNVYVCGNGGAKPRHADLLVADLDEETAIRYLDRFIMYYIATADRLTRTSVWLEKMDGGIEYLRDVIISDRLGICAELEKDMQFLVDTYQCEWAAVVRDPERRARFRHFANSVDSDQTIEFVEERGQQRPSDWPKKNGHASGRVVRLPIVQRSWVRVGRALDFPENGGAAVQYGRVQLAVFHFASRGTWYACQNMCPHMRDMVLGRGIIGDQAGIPKVACPQHKKTFSLENGECLSGDPYRVQTFPVRVTDGWVEVELPSTAELEAALATDGRLECAVNSLEQSAESA